MEIQKQLPDFYCEGQCLEPDSPGQPKITPNGKNFLRVGDKFSIVASFWLGRGRKAASVAYNLFHEQQLVYEKTSEENGTYQQNWEQLIKVTDDINKNNVQVTIMIKSLDQNLTGRWSFGTHTSHSPVEWKIDLIEDASWGEWGPWSECSKTCLNFTETKPGERYRTRDCHEGNSHGVGCDKLVGGNERKEPCPDLVICPTPSVLTSWTEWTNCDCVNKSGDIGQETRTRYCYPGIKTPCPQNEEREERNCSCTKDCTVEWGDWSNCSASCINTTETDLNKMPKKIRQSNKRVGRDCPTVSAAQRAVRITEEMPCTDLPNCPIDCKWSSWGQVSIESSYLCKCIFCSVERLQPQMQDR